MLHHSKYINKIVIGLSCWIIGIVIQFIVPEGVTTLRYPQNIQAGLIFVVILIGIYLYGNKLKWFKILSSPQLSIVSMLMVAILVLCTGLIPQTPKSQEFITEFGLRSITNSWFFALSMLLLLTNLGLVILRRVNSFNKRNIAFLFNHLGLWITLFAVYLGSGDMVKLRTGCRVGQTCAIAQDDNNLNYKLPFAITLQHFEQKNYTSALVVINSETHKFRLLSDNLKTNQSYFANNSTIKILSLNTVQNEIKEVQVELNSDTLLLKSGLNQEEIQVAQLGNDSLLLLKRGAAKSYTSFISLNNKSYQIEVNKPLIINGWSIYQVSYEEDDNGNTMSIFELIRDPWLPVVYIGFIMILVGAIFLFWEGKKLTNNASI
jgi:hypothetical protein